MGLTAWPVNYVVHLNSYPSTPVRWHYGPPATLGNRYSILRLLSNPPSLLWHFGESLAAAQRARPLNLNPLRCSGISVNPWPQLRELAPWISIPFATLAFRWILGRSLESSPPESQSPSLLWHFGESLTTAQRTRFLCKNPHCLPSIRGSSTWSLSKRETPLPPLQGALPVVFRQPPNPKQKSKLFKFNYFQ